MIKRMIRKVVLNAFEKAGLSLQKSLPAFLDSDFRAAYTELQPFTMVDWSGALSVWDAVEHIARNNIEGDFVECGVWRGGTSLLAHRKMMDCGLTDRKLYLYDTFQGMSDPTENDVDLGGGVAAQRMSSERKVENSINVWAYASREDVENNIREFAGHEFAGDPDHFKLVEGKVEDTIPAVMPDSIAILRLDTDWYESTKHELEHLYDKLNKGGVLLIDDYGVWKGCRKAVDEFFADKEEKPYFVMTAKGGLAGVKP